MAGIGFELKKLFNRKGLLSNVRAYFYSVFVTIGPVIISVLAITFLYMMLKYFGVPRKEIELLQATILYSFVFSVILTSGFAMMLSRYLSDRLYMNSTEDVMPTFYGSLAVMLTVSGLIGIAFYYRSPLDPVYRLAAYLLFVQLALQVVMNIFISAIKDFKRVAFSFLFGTLSAFAFGGLLVKSGLADGILAVLIAFNVCILLVNLLLAHEVRRYFSQKSSRYFDFLKYFHMHILIMLTNLFYVSGIYIHHFVFWWKSNYARIMENTYIYAPLYDIPSTYAFLSVMPTLVMFVVKVETAFYEKYRNFFHLINEGACYEDIEGAKQDMIRTVYKEIIYMMEIQMFFSIGFIIAGLKLLPFLGFTAAMIDLYSILVLAYFCMVVSFVVMTILLYYDNRKAACGLALLFMTTNGLFSLISIYYGDAWHGFGFLVSGLVTVIVAFMTLKHNLTTLEYRIFCIQVSWRAPKESAFEAAVERLNRIGVK